MAKQIPFIKVPFVKQLASLNGFIPIPRTTVPLEERLAAANSHLAPEVRIEADKHTAAWWYGLPV